MDSHQISSNLAIVKQRISKACADAGRDPNEITLVAVSKTKPTSYIEYAMEHEQVHFGENRMQELDDKMTELAGKNIEWHMIGNLQTNKIKFIADRVHWVHSIEKLKYLKEFEKRAADANHHVKALIQVNISNEKQKGGCKPEALKDLLLASQSFKHVTVCGLMGMATFTDDESEVRSEFKLLKSLFDEHKQYSEGSVQLEHISMGMSNDMEIAIQEGATMLRIGSDIFGARN